MLTFGDYSLTPPAPPHGADLSSAPSQTSVETPPLDTFDASTPGGHHAFPGVATIRHALRHPDHGHAEGLSQDLVDHAASRLAIRAETGALLGAALLCHAENFAWAKSALVLQLCLEGYTQNAEHIADALAVAAACIAVGQHQRAAHRHASNGFLLKASESLGRIMSAGFLGDILDSQAVIEAYNVSHPGPHHAPTPGGHDAFPSAAAIRNALGCPDHSHAEGLSQHFVDHTASHTAIEAETGALFGAALLSHTEMFYSAKSALVARLHLDGDPVAAERIGNALATATACLAVGQHQRAAHRHARNGRVAKANASPHRVINAGTLGEILESPAVIEAYDVTNPTFRASQRHQSSAPAPTPGAEHAEATAPKLPARPLTDNEYPTSARTSDGLFRHQHRQFITAYAAEINQGYLDTARSLWRVQPREVKQTYVDLAQRLRETNMLPATSDT